MLDSAGGFLTNQPSPLFQLEQFWNSSSLLKVSRIFGLINVLLCVGGGEIGCLFKGLYHPIKSFLGPKWTSSLTRGSEASRPSLWLETSLFRFGPKIAILGGFRFILGAFFGPPMGPQISFCPNGPHHHCWH